tara:strand:- start:8788 stop:9522 length:735 start_codon:yes stop_codon:yes gene_type:complete
MDYKYKFGLTIVACIIYNRFSIYAWRKIVLNNSNEQQSYQPPYQPPYQEPYQEQIGGTNYRNVKKKCTSGGGFIDKLKNRFAPKSPVKLFLYWLLILLLMCLIAVIFIIGVNSYAEITQNNSSNVSKKDVIKNYITDKLLDYLIDNWKQIFYPFLVYCIIRLVFDFLYYDGEFIPILGDIVMGIEHIPILWTAGFAIYVFTIYYALISIADVKMCDGVKKRCIPSFEEACDTDPDPPSWCWFKI